MLDINTIRTQPDRVRAAILAKKAKADLDGCWRRTRNGGRRRRSAEAAGGAERREQGDGAADEGGPAEGEKLKARMKETSERRKALERREEAGGGADRLLLYIPNIPHPDVPVGEEETHNKVVKQVASRRRSRSSRWLTGIWGRSWESRSSSAGRRFPVRGS